MWIWETTSEDPRGTVVVVHGASEHHGRYHWLRKQWQKAGYHVVMGDLPGQGKAPKNRGHVDSFDEYIVTIANWVDQAESFGLPVLLLGHSLGGLSVIRALQEKKVQPDLVILSSPCLGLVVPPPEWLKRTLKPVNRYMPTVKIPIKRSTENILATRNESILERDKKDPYIVKKVSVRWYFELDQAMKTADEKIKQMPNIPVLIMQAGEDRIVDKHMVYRWFRRLPIPNKQYKEWSGFYHEIFNEPKREEVFRYLIRAIHRLI